MRVRQSHLKCHHTNCLDTGTCIFGDLSRIADATLGLVFGRLTGTTNPKIFALLAAKTQAANDNANSCNTFV